VDDAGRPWTPMESKALSKRPNALLWTLMDSAWRSTDQEVGCSSRPGRAAVSRSLTPGPWVPLDESGGKEGHGNGQHRRREFGPDPLPRDCGSIRIGLGIARGRHYEIAVVVLEVATGREFPSCGRARSTAAPAPHWRCRRCGEQKHAVDARITDTSERDQLWQNVVLKRAPSLAKYEENSGRVIPIALLTPKGGVILTVAPAGFFDVCSTGT